MERHPFWGVVNEEITRPSAEVIEGFKRHDVAKVGDAMAAGGIMNYEIKPLVRGSYVVGPAVTVMTRGGDALMIQKVADVAQPGDVIIVDAGGEKDSAIIGERISYYMKEKRGIAGLVVDGAVRDTKGIIEIGFPVWTRAVTPRIYGTQGPGAINVPVQCGGVMVNPGDLIIADADGVAVVPRQHAAAVLAGADAHLAGELERLQRVENGEKLSVINNCDAKIARWRD